MKRTCVKCGVSWFGGETIPARCPECDGIGLIFDGDLQGPVEQGSYLLGRESAFSEVQQALDAVKARKLTDDAPKPTGEPANPTPQNPSDLIMSLQMLADGIVQGGDFIAETARRAIDALNQKQTEPR